MASSATIKILSPAWALIPSPISQASPARPACQECGLFSTCKTPFMSAHVPAGWSGLALGVGEAPGGHEDLDSGRPFSGPAGKLLYRLWTEAGWSERDLALVNSVRCRPRGNTKPSAKNIRACRPFLADAINKLQPKFVIAFGETAMKALLNDCSASGVGRSRGKPQLIPGLNAPFFVTYHPASVLHGNLDHADRIREDMARMKWKRVEYPEDGGIPIREMYGFDTEYAPDGKPLNLGLATEFSSGVWEPNKHWPPKWWPSVRKIVGHSIGGDVDVLVRLAAAKETWVRGLDIRDSLLIARMANENRGKGQYGVETLLCSSENVDPWKWETEAFGTDATKWPADLRAKRCRLDAWASLRVADKFLPMARGPLVLAHRIALTLQRVRHAGMYISMSKFKEFYDKTYRAHTRLSREIVRLAGEAGYPEFEPTNDHHLRAFIYGTLKVPITDATAKGAGKVDKWALLRHKDEHLYFARQIQFNKVDKLWTTYAQSIAEKFVKISPSRSWLETGINPLGARTGRRSSGKDSSDFMTDDESGVNYQNWPKPFRQVVCSRFKDGLISDNDYSKLEMILLGWEAGDEKLVEYFSGNENGYVRVGRDLFKKNVEPGTREYTTTKSTVLGIGYNMKPWKLAKQLWEQLNVRFSTTWESHLRIVEEIHGKYLTMFPGISRYQRACIQALHRDHYIEGALGQRRRLPLPPEPPQSEYAAWRAWRKVVNHAENQAVNFKIQWLASLVTGCAMLDVEEALLDDINLSYTDYHRMLLEKEWPRIPLLINEVHDDLVFDHPPDKRRVYEELIGEVMTEVPTLRALLPELRGLPLKVEHTIGPYWGKEVT